MLINTIYNESCMETLTRMPDNYLHSVITSPPYWQLRDYGYEGQWGLETTYTEYLENLWAMMDEIHRVLRNDGTVWVNLGDVYARGQRTNDGNVHSLFQNGANPIPISKPNYNGLNKTLLLLPHRFAIGCIERGWIVRNDCIWAKRNCMPESVTDRFSKKHEYFFFMVKSEKYYFDLDSIREKYKDSSIQRILQGRSDTSKHFVGNVGNENLSKPRANRKYSGEALVLPDGKNPGSVSDFWDIPTKGTSAKHYASYNDSLLLKPVLAGCPEGGIIYDPFIGTGSTAECALRSNRKFIGSEMSAEYCDIANKRLQPYLQQFSFV